MVGTRASQEKLSTINGVNERRCIPSCVSHDSTQDPIMLACLAQRLSELGPCRILHRFEAGGGSTGAQKYAQVKWSNEGGTVN